MGARTFIQMQPGEELLIAPTLLEAGVKTIHEQLSCGPISDVSMGMEMASPSCRITARLTP